MAVLTSGVVEISSFDQALRNFLPIHPPANQQTVKFQKKSSGLLFSFQSTCPDFDAYIKTFNTFALFTDGGSCSQEEDRQKAE